LCPDNSRARFKRHFAIRTCHLLDESGKTAGPVSAHIRRASIAVVKIPGPIRFAAPRGHKNQNTIRSYAALAAADANDILRAQTNFLLSIVDEHKIIPGPIHLDEPNVHWELKIKAMLKSAKMKVNHAESRLLEYVNKAGGGRIFRQSGLSLGLPV